MFADKKTSLSTYLLYVLVFLAPLFIIPSNFYSIEFAKTSLIVLGVVVIAVLYLFSVIREKKMVMMPKIFMWPTILLVLSVILSTLSSSNLLKSFLGQGFELNTASFILALLATLSLTYKLIYNDTKKVLVVYSALIGSYSLLYIYHALRFIFGATFLNLGSITSLTASPLGSWNDFGILSVVVMLLSLIALKYLNLPGKAKLGAWLVFLLSAIPVLLLNSATMLACLAIVIAFLVFYMYQKNPASTFGLFASLKSKTPWLFVALFVFVVLFYSQGYRVSNPVNEAIGSSYGEVSLTWRSTLDVLAGSLKASPLLGIGPNVFTQAYTTFKPDAVNTTDLWSLEFAKGYGWLMTFVATQGVFGLVSWFIFLVAFFFTGKKLISARTDDTVLTFVAVSSFTGSAFLWLMFLVGTASHVNMFISMVLTGIFVGSAASLGIAKGVEVDFSENKKYISYVSIVVIVLFVVWGVFGIRKVIGMSYFSAGVKHLTTEGTLDAATASFNSAIKVDNSSIYWQALVETDMAKINKLVTSVDANTDASTTAAIAAEAGKIANEALVYSEKAIALDPFNYYNYVSRARVGETATLLKMDKAAEVTVESYKNAIQLNGKNPEVYLNLARFLASQEDFDGALQVIGMSLNVKNNYIDGIYLLSQIQAAKGDLKNAIISAKVATEINPNNALLFFQLGILDYNDASYADAATALEKAISLNAEYANAIYFLGLSYARLNRTDDAVTQFEILAKANPENTEVSAILTALMSGKNIFKVEEVAQAEKSPKLPIKQK